VDRVGERRDAVAHVEDDAAAAVVEAEMTGQPA
jgi:hypothetical protein